MFDLKTRILVVDDMMTMRKLVGKVCRELGFTDIIEAEDGAKAWDALGGSTPPVGLIISDWNMPNLSGLEFLKKVRGDAKFAKLPFLMVTAEAEQHQIIDAIKSGVSNYVVKPFTAEALRDKIEAVHFEALWWKMTQLDARFFKPFVEGAMNTLKTQCGLTITTDKPFIKGQQTEPQIAIAGVIGITSPTFNGTITLCFPEKVFLGAMSKMLGEEYKEITNDLQDGVAELLNIIFGQAKIVLNEQGHEIKKAIPTVIRGTNLSTRSMTKALVMVLPFKTDLGDFYIEICSETSM